MAEAAARDAEERYTSLFEGSRDAIVSADRDAVIVEANSAALKLFGCSRKDLIGRRALSYPGVGADLGALLEELTERGYLEDVEFSFRRDDGTRVHCLLSASVRRSKNGRLNGFVGILRDVSQRHAALEALRSPEAKYRFLFEQSPMMNFIIGMDGTVRDVNEAVVQGLGYGIEEICGRPALSFVAPESRAAAAESLETDLRGEEAGELEVGIVAKNGSVHSVLFRPGRAVIYENGQPAAILIAGIDLTDRNRAEMALHESDEKYRTLFEESLDVVYITSRDGTLVDISPSAASLFGYTREELLRMDVRGLYANIEDRKMFQEEVERTGAVHGFPVRLLHKDGGVRECLLTSTVRRAPDGTTVGYQGIIRDVTEQRRVERARNREREALRTIAEAAVRATDVPDLCRRALSGFIRTFAFDLGTIRLYDDGTRTLRVVAVEGLSEEDLQKVNDQPIESGHHTSAFVARTGRPILAPDVTEHDIWRTHAARLRELRLRALVSWPIFDTKEELLGVLQLGAHEPKELVIEDASLFDTIAEMLAAVLERRQALEDKEEMRSQLLQAQKMEAVGRLASGIAHDFNNLLTAIHGFAELALASEDLPERLRPDLDRIRTSAERGARLVRQLLLFSRKEPVHLTPVDLNMTTQELSKILAPLIGEDIAMNVVLDSELWPVMADAASIQQMLMNLAVNARDAMPAGGTLTIETTNTRLSDECCADRPEARPGRFVCLSVRDTGTGMSDDVKAHIFEPFFSTKARGKGTGLGLAVAYGIAKQHGGWIEVESTEGAGATFRIYLPAVTEEPRRAADVGAPAWALAGGGERILVVEDEDTVRDFAVRALKRSGYVVFAAANVSEALRVFNEQNREFDLVFSDVVLPDGSGVQLIQEIMDEKPDLPILLSSGHADDKSRWETIRDRGLPFIPKPYSLPELLRTVRETIRAH